MNASIASAAQLARFHAVRATLYRAIAFLIGAPPNERTRSVARGILRECAGSSPAKDAIERALASKMSLADGAVECPPCETRCDRVRDEAFHAALREGEDGPGSEAEVLSALAEQSARALRCNDISEASRLADLQARFLEEHAAYCLLALAKQMKADAGEYPRMLGTAIEVLVASDRSMLSAH